MGAEVTFPAAFFAGLLSFLSPCVLPLVPPYLCFLAGTTLEELASDETPPEAGRRTVAAAGLFVLGFATVFTLLGAAASALGQVLRLYQDWLAWFAGIVVILMGLHFLGLLRIGLLYRDVRFRGPSEPAGLWSGYVMGLAFAFGWTPCIGPVLAAVLSVAARENTVASGMALLATYALGIGVPFVGAALAINPFLGFLARFRGHFARVEKTMGGLLVATGVLFLTGWLTQFSFWILETFPALGRLG